MRFYVCLVASKKGDRKERKYNCVAEASFFSVKGLHRSIKEFRRKDMERKARILRKKCNTLSLVFLPVKGSTN